MTNDKVLSDGNLVLFQIEWTRILRGRQLDEIFILFSLLK